MEYLILTPSGWSCQIWINSGKVLPRFKTMGRCTDRTTTWKTGPVSTLCLLLIASVFFLYPLLRWGVNICSFTQSPREKELYQAFCQNSPAFQKSAGVFTTGLFSSFLLQSNQENAWRSFGSCLSMLSFIRNKTLSAKTVKTTLSIEKGKHICESRSARKQDVDQGSKKPFAKGGASNCLHIVLL